MKNLRLLSLAVTAMGLLIACQGAPQTADYRVVPLPASIAPESEVPAFLLKASVPIFYVQPELEKEAAFLSEYVAQLTGISLQARPFDETYKGNAIVLAILEDTSKPESYEIHVTEREITLSGGSAAGVFYGIQTLRKSLPVVKTNKVLFPCVLIQDAPRFGYRGLHFDVARHFFTIEEVKQYIDILALHNMNRFHWHLTDDQGWRMESKKYPLLTEIGSQRKQTVVGHNTSEYDGVPHGGFYTQEEMRDVVAYAQERHITIVPEIDMPGHMLAALAAYPELGCTGGPYETETRWGVFEDVLCAGNDKTLDFIADILNELMDIFPGELIHVGGDECPKTRWEVCPRCQQRIKALGIKGDKNHTAEQYLQSFIINHAEKVVNARGRQIIGWDEILEGGLAPNATVMSWRGMGGGEAAAKMHHPVVMTPNTYLYFDYYQTNERDQEPFGIGGYVPVELVYSLEPVPSSLSDEEEKYILGAQANLWTEYVARFEHAQSLILPRAAALCEVQWMQPEAKNYDDFLSRVTRLITDYEALGYTYASFIFDVVAQITPLSKQKCIGVTLHTPDNVPIYYTLDGTDPTKTSSVYQDTLKIDKTSVLKACAFRETSTSSRILTKSFYFNKATCKDVSLLTQPHPNYKYRGAETLVDGLRGDSNYKTGRWLGFQGNDITAVIDLGTATSFQSVAFNACVEKGDWVFDARGVLLEVSQDGVTYQKAFEETYPASTQESPNGVINHKHTFPEVNARFVRVTILSEHTLPTWHAGAGIPAFVFVDEIELD